MIESIIRNRYVKKEGDHMMNPGTSAGGAAAAAIQNAIKANGAIVYLEADDFMKILSRTPNPIVITAIQGVFSRKHRYLTAYQGFIFYTRTPDELSFSMPVELIVASKIWVPDI